MTTPGASVPAGAGPPATDGAGTGRLASGEDVRLARLHLRLGMHAVARAELEDLGGRGALDKDGLAVLAEARWRTGDLEGAADVADAHLGAGGSDPVAIVIAAEAAAVAGQAADARALVDRLRGLDPATLDAIFAGIAHRALWPGAATPASDAATGTPAATAASPGKARAYPPARASAVPGPAEVLQSNAGLWDDEPAAAAATPAATAAATAHQPAAQTWVEPARAKGHADPEQELEAARDELDVAPERGLLRLALVLRLDPTLAPDVLDVIRLRREPAALVLRGDAERLLGRHLEAEAAFADAIELIEREALAIRAAHDRDPYPTPAAAPERRRDRESTSPSDRQEDS
jgi:hypothetical protein